MIAEALQFEFFRNALVAAVFASVVCGIIGTFVVVKEVSSVSGGLAHAAFGGIGLGYVLGVNPLLSAAVFSVLLGVGIGALSLRYRDSLETLVALIWSFGMALGILFLSFTPGYTADVTAYLFGNILLVSREFLWWALLFDLIVLGVTLALLKELKAIVFDEDYARVMGLRVAPLFLLLMAFVSLSVVILIRLVGMILTIALLTIPALTARHWASRLTSMMLLSGLLATVSSVIGLLLSLQLSRFSPNAIPPGPVIILLAIALYAVSLIATHLRRGDCGKG